MRWRPSARNLTHHILFGVCVLNGLCFLSSASGQGSAADYERADSLAQQSRNKVFRHQVRPNWVEQNGVTKACWYRVQTGPETYEFVGIDLATPQRRPLFDHDRLATALTDALEKPFAPDRLPFQTLVWSDDLAFVEFTAEGRLWRWDRTEEALEPCEPSNEDATTVERMAQPRRSRDRGGETSIHFVNRWKAPVKLIWMDRAGEQVEYGTLAVGETHDQHTFVGHVWLVTSEDGTQVNVYRATERPGTAVIDGTAAPASDEGARRRGPSTRSPNERWRVFVRDENLWVRSEENGDEFALTSNGRPDAPYLEQVVWSPDSKQLVAIQQERGDDRRIALIESSPEDQLQPKLQELPYTKPGDRIDHPHLVLINVANRRCTPIADDVIPHPWSISEIRWDEESSRFTFLYNARGHQRLAILAVDASTAEVGVLVDETSETFVDYAHKKFSHYVESTHELIWMSERSGWNHLYRVDLRTGDVLNAITHGSWVVRNVDFVDEESRHIWFYASGLFPEQDPYYLHYCRTDFEGKELVVLTEGNGTHEIDLSPDRRFLVDRYSRVDQPPVITLRDGHRGALLCSLEAAEISALEATGWRAPIRFKSPGRDGKTPIFGVIFLPKNHLTEHKYPVIEHIYAGPQSSYVPKAFSSYYNEQAIAELGFIVVKIDGMGTSHRSKAFHDVAWKNLGDGGFPDRIAWMRAAKEAYPSMDLDRVGIYGGSAGGQNALRAVLAHPDFYRVAVADCGCHDNRMDKIWWNELWMGWPIGPHYEEQSNVTQAHRLEGKLLLTVGELDRNVDPASTMQVVDALIRADKDFDLIVFPGRGHGIGESAYGRRRRRDFFVRHLLGVEPRHEAAGP